jgi:hypothetical protein
MLATWVDIANFLRLIDDYTESSPTALTKKKAQTKKKAPTTKLTTRALLALTTKLTKTSIQL